jgi:hypothetical protein
MKLNKKEREFLATLSSIAEKLLTKDNAKGKRNGVRRRRSGDDLRQLKKQVLAARRRKVPVAQIAEELGITPSYVYQIVGA